MRGHTIAAGAVAALTVVASLAITPQARAETFGIEINGTYHYYSNGEFAKVNQVFKNEPTVEETWTMSSSCTTPIQCEGTVKSSAGWTARLWFGYPEVNWTVDRDIPEWQFCPGGGTAPGRQRFQFWGTNLQTPGYRDLKITDFMVGRQTTSSPSGSCGTNQPLLVQLPMDLTKV